MRKALRNKGLAAPYHQLYAAAYHAVKAYGGSMWVVPDGLSGVYTDSSGATPAANVGDVIGLITDRSYGSENLGPELAGLDTPWQNYGTGISLSGGQMLFNASPSGQFAMRGVGLTPGKTYRVSFTVQSISGGSLRMPVGGGAGTTPVSVPGTYAATVTSTQIDGPYLWVESGTVTAVVTSASCREVLGNHATQSTAGSMPTLVKVPRRLGPNLVVNGDFSSGTTGWSATNSATLAAVAGELEITANGATNYPGANASVAASVGKSYVMVFTGRRGTSTSIASMVVGGVTPAYNMPFNSTTANITVSMIVTATASTITLNPFIHGSPATAGTCIFGNISVQEVLEWGWGMQFGGVDDTLSIPKLINIGSDHTVVCSGKSPSSLAAYPFLFSPAVGTASVAEMYADAGKYVAFRWKNDAGTFTYATVGGAKTLNENQPFVASVVSKAGGLTTPYHDGVAGAQIASPTGTSALSTAGRIGVGEGGFNTTGYGSFFAVIPAAIPASDRIAIERFAAYQAGAPYAY